MPLLTGGGAAYLDLFWVLLADFVVMLANRHKFSDLLQTAKDMLANRAYIADLLHVPSYIMKPDSVDCLQTESFCQNVSTFGRRLLTNLRFPLKCKQFFIPIAYKSEIPFKMQAVTNR